MKIIQTHVLRTLRLFFLLLISQQAYASHMAGSEITYTCIGPNQYSVRLVIYRDCNGITADATAVVQYQSTACGVNASLQLNLQSTTDITPLCPSEASACGGGGAFGMEKLVYLGTLTLPNGCSDWVLSYDLCCRNEAITNLTSPDGEDIYVRTTLNNTLSSCNSSPQFASIPQLFGCVGSTINFQQLASDPDGDQLVYSLINANSNPGTYVVYAGGFSGANPFTDPTTINSATGEVSVTPSVPQVAVLSVLVQEYRAGVLIGSVIRDLQINILDCTNALPAIGGINGVLNDYDITICQNASVCFTVNIADPNIGQLVAVTNSNLPAGATMTITGAGANRTATICWTPSAANIGTNYITINAQDNACPLIGQNSEVITINVVANPNPPVNAGGNVTVCAGSSTVLNATTAAVNASTYVWSPAIGLSGVNTPSVTATPGATTSYSVSLTYTDGCVSTDDVLVTVAADPVATLFPTTINACGGGTVQLIGNTNVTGMNYQWFDPSLVSLGAGAFIGTSNTLNVIAPTAPGSYVYTFRVTNPFTGCTSQTTMTIVVGAPSALPSCVNIYVTTTGTVGNPGTQAAPTSLANALTLAQCNNAVIKVATGTYTIDNALTIGSYLTIEGGFNPTTWVKSSLAGATTITRSTANPEVAAGAQRIVAFYGNSATNFRFQDITITTANANLAGMSTYGLHLTNCSNYNIVRTQILPGSGAAGAGDDNVATYNSTWDGANGGNGTNGTTGNGPQCTCSLSADNGGSGSGGGAGGTGGLNALIIGGSATNGGAGGAGGNGRPDNTSAAGFPGVAGTAAPSGGGAGGTAGTGGAQDGNGASTSNVGNGGAGGVGTAGIPGVPGTSAHVAGFFVPGNGTNGTSALGGGGGGGGGGAGRDTDGCDAAGGGGSGGSGGGGGGGAGRGASGGGGSFGIYLFNNAAGGNVIQSNVTAGAAGAAGLGGRGGNGGNPGTSSIGNGCTNGDADGNRGGIGGAGGAGGAGGNGGNGSAGVSINIHLASGTTLATNVSNFNLAAQPTVTVNNVSCINTDVTYNSAVSTAWDFDVITNFATPATAVATTTPASTQYSAINRYSVSQGANTYTGFHNVAYDGSLVPEISTNATLIAPDHYQLCAGSFANFQSVYSASSYQWNFSGAIANPATTLQNVNGQFNIPGNYTITLALVTDCCGLSPTKTIELHILPIPTVTPSAPTSVCSGNNITLTVNGLSASDLLSWSPTTGILSQTSNTITLSPSVTGNYIATVFSTSVVAGVGAIQGCPVTLNFPVTVNTNPTVNLNGTSVICNNDGTATSIPTPTGNYNYSWSNGSTTTSATSSAITNLPSANYTVTVTNPATGCFATGSINIFATNGQPNLFVTTNTPACEGVTNGAATVNTVGGLAAYTLVWNGTPYPNTGTLTQTNLAGGTYPVSITDNNGCTSSLAVTVPELVAPDYDITTNILPCAGSDGIFYVSGTDGAVLTYNFGAGNSTIVLSDETEEIILPGITTTTTMYLVSVADDCSVPLSSSIILVVDPCGLGVELTDFNASCVDRIINFNWNTESETNNDYFSLEGSVDGVHFETLQLIDGAGTTNLEHAYATIYERNDPNMTYFRLKQTDFDGEVTLFNSLSVECNISTTDLYLYPNPSDGDFAAVLNLKEMSKTTTIRILDLTGRIVKTSDVSTSSGVNQLYISATDLPRGEYLIEVTPMGQEMMVKRFVIQ